VNGLCDQFLARAAFPQDEHGGSSRRHLLHELKDLLHGRGFADDILHSESSLDMLPQRGVFVFQRLVAQRLRDSHFQLVDLAARPLAI